MMPVRKYNLHVSKMVARELTRRIKDEQVNEPEVLFICTNETEKSFLKYKTCKLMQTTRSKRYN